jgi:hypothetical protein
VNFSEILKMKTNCDKNSRKRQPNSSRRGSSLPLRKNEKTHPMINTAASGAASGAASCAASRAEVGGGKKKKMRKGINYPEKYRHVHLDGKTNTLAA